MGIHEKNILRCINLALRAFGETTPNPMVGCVIVCAGKIIGEGYHQQYGAAHAEVNAINSVRDKSLLSQSTLYVNLEPCSHFGKTPPCVDLLITHKIKLVVIGTMDPNPKVSGMGIKKLISSGCDVKLGVLEEECREVNRRFFTYYEKKRPYIILKWAQTRDGFIGVKDKKIKITTEKLNKLVHQWRSEEQAIMVGTQTALVDNPKLTVRKIKGKSPMRIVLDRRLKIPDSYHLIDKQVPTLVFTEKKKISKINLEYVVINFDKEVLYQILKELYKRQIQSLIVEGGAKLINSFINEECWDEARILSGAKWVRPNAKGIDAPIIQGRQTSKKNIGKESYTCLRRI